MNNVFFQEVNVDGMAFDVVYVYFGTEFEVLQVKLLDEIDDESERDMIENDWFELVANKAKEIVEA